MSEVSEERKESMKLLSSSKGRCVVVSPIVRGLALVLIVMNKMSTVKETSTLDEIYCIDKLNEASPLSLLVTID